MKTVMNIWLTALVFTYPVCFATAIPLQYVVPYNREFFYLHMFGTFVIIFSVLVLKNEWANDFVRAIRLK